MTTASPALSLDTPLARVLSRLPGAKRQGREYRAKCPVHGDNDPSLEFRAGDDGRVLFTCRSQRCDWRSIVAALGLEERDVFPPKVASNGNGKRSPVLREIPFDYTDENGAVLYQAIRRELDDWDEVKGKHKKTFTQRRPDGTDRWIYNLDGVRRVLYRMGEVIEALSEGRTLHIVEGEQKADVLRNLGLVATTNVGGAGKWKDEYTTVLAGASVVLYPDNDDSGRAHMMAIAAALVGTGCTVRVVELPNLPAKGDVVDWIAKGGTRQQLEEIVQRTPLWGAVAPATDALPAPVRLLDAPPSKAIAWAVSDFWPAGEYGLLVGEDGSFKTTLLLLMACAKAGGYAVFGRFPCEAGPVLLVSQEDSIDVLRNRVEAMIRGHGWNRERVLGNLHVHALDGVSLSSSRWIEHLTATITRIGATFVGLDNLAELADGDENDNSDRRKIVAGCRELTRPTNAAVCLVHHAGKGGTDRRKKDRIRGATAVPSGSRVTYFVELHEQGLSVECLKMSRMEKLSPFVIRHIIESEPGNRAMWTLARFETMTQGDANLQAAVDFIVAQLEGGSRMSTTDLKTAAKDKSNGGTGVSGADVSRALKMMHELQHRIDFLPGEKGAKLWGLVCLPEDFRQAGNQTLGPAGQSEWLPGKQGEDVLCLPIGTVGSTSPCAAGLGKQEFHDHDAALETGE